MCTKVVRPKMDQPVSIPMYVTVGQLQYVYSLVLHALAIRTMLFKLVHIYQSNHPCQCYNYNIRSYSYTANCFMNLETAAQTV